MDLKTYIRRDKKRRPKTWAKMQARWNIKMIRDVGKLSSHILKNVNPRLFKLARKSEWIISAPEIEHEVWKLLEKTRRITLIEKRKKRP